MMNPSVRPANASSNHTESVNVEFTGGIDILDKIIEGGGEVRKAEKERCFRTFGRRLAFSCYVEYA